MSDKIYLIVCECDNIVACCESEKEAQEICESHNSLNCKFGEAFAGKWEFIELHKIRKIQNSKKYIYEAELDYNNKDNLQNFEIEYIKLLKILEIFETYELEQCINSKSGIAFVQAELNLPDPEKAKKILIDKFYEELAKRNGV